MEVTAGLQWERDSENKGNIIYSDNNGVSWTQGSFESQPLYDIVDVAYGNGSGETKWVAISQSSKSWKSTDGINWTMLDLNNYLGNEGWLQSIEFGDSTWVAVGKNGNVIYATDPSVSSQWTSATYSVSKHLTGVAYGNGQFIAVGQGLEGLSGEAPVLIISDNNGQTWTEKNLPADFIALNNPLIDIAYGDGRWSALGNFGDHLLSTDNGSTWQVIATGKYGAFAIAYRP